MWPKLPSIIASALFIIPSTVLTYIFALLSSNIECLFVAVPRTHIITFGDLCVHNRKWLGHFSHTTIIGSVVNNVPANWPCHTYARPDWLSRPCPWSYPHVNLLYSDIPIFPRFGPSGHCVIKSSVLKFSRLGRFPRRPSFLPLEWLLFCFQCFHIRPQLYRHCSSRKNSFYCTLFQSRQMRILRVV